MLGTLPILLASTVFLGGDSVKKKTTAPPAPARTTVATATPGRLSAGRVPERKPMLLGAAIERSFSSTIRSAAPRASYLSNAVKARVAGGPPLPERFRGSEAGVAVVADSIVVEKARRTLTLYNQGAPVRIYFVALGAAPVGHKATVGDGRTPEGLYRIVGHNPDSKYHLSLKVSYPNDADLAAARARGVTTGGDIMIHGLPDRFAEYGALHRKWDWTKGCIAVTNAEIEEIWAAVGDGAAIQIKP